MREEVRVRIVFVHTDVIDLGDESKMIEASKT